MSLAAPDVSSAAPLESIMLKPASLRSTIEAALPDLARDPDRLLVFIDEGTVRCTAATSLSFEYGYTLRVVVTDYARHADTLIVPVLRWVATHQPELLANFDMQKTGIRFEADLLNKSSMDLSILLTLTERVVVSANPDAPGLLAEHVGEPPLDPYDYVESWELYIRHPDGTQEAVV